MSLHTNSKPQRKPGSIQSLLSDSTEQLYKKPKLIKITDYFNQQRNGRRFETGSQCSFSKNDDDERKSCTSHQQHVTAFRRALSEVGNLENDDAQSQKRSGRSGSVTSGPIFKSPSAVSYQKSTIICDFDGGLKKAQVPRNLTFSYLLNKNVDGAFNSSSDSIAHSSSSCSQDNILAMLTPNNSQSDESCSNKTNSSQGALCSEKNKSSNVNTSNNLSQDIFSSDSFSNTQSSNNYNAVEQNKETVAVCSKRNRPAVSYEEFPEFHFDILEDETIFYSSSNSIFNTQKSNLNASQKILTTPSARSSTKKSKIHQNQSSVAEDWKTKMVEGIKMIRKAEIVAYEQLVEIRGWCLKSDKGALIAKISNILEESERTGIIKYRKTCYSNCVFSENR